MSDVKKIIIADASEEYRGMLADALGDREDMEVVAQTGDGEALLDLVAKHQPQGIIMDLMLTGMDGLEVLEQLGPNRPRVVVLSAFSHSALAQQVADQQLENQALAAAIENSDDPEMLEQVARDRGLVKQGEELYVDVAN